LQHLRHASHAVHRVSFVRFTAEVPGVTFTLRDTLWS